MSLIHQALKKADGASRGAAANEYAFRTSGVKFIRKYALPVVFIISVIAAYLLFVPAKKTDTRHHPPIAVKTPVPHQMPAPAIPADFNAQGMDEFRAGRFSDAETNFRKVLGSKPQSASAHNNLGITLMKLGKNGGAEDAFKKALELEPGHIEALNNYACLLAETGRSKKALPLLEKAMGIDPAYADARLNLAVLLEKKGDLQGAFDNYSAFLDLNGADKDAPLVRKQLMVLRSGLILKQAGGR